MLVRRYADGTELRGKIVETEAYLGGEDKASHSAGGKRTERNTAMFMKPGTIYVYPIYGIYLCMNVSSEGRWISSYALCTSFVSPCVSLALVLWSWLCDPDYYAVKVATE